MSGQEVEVKEVKAKVEWLKGLLDDDDESDSSGSDSPPLPKASVAASAPHVAPVTQVEPPTEADEPNGRAARKRPERTTQREQAKKEKTDEEAEETKAAEKPKRATRKRPLPTEAKAEKDGAAKALPKGRKKPADASAASARNSARNKRVEGSAEEPKPEADEPLQPPETPIPLVSPVPKRLKREDAKDPIMKPVDALIAALDKPARRPVKKESADDGGAIDGERLSKKTPEARKPAVMEAQDSAKKKRLPPAAVDAEPAKRSARSRVQVTRIETSDSEQDQAMKKPADDERAPAPAAKRFKRESEKKKRVNSTDEKMANTLKELSRDQAKAKAAEKPAVRVKTEALEKRVRRLPKREPDDRETRKQSIESQTKEEEEKPGGKEESRHEAAEAKHAHAKVKEEKESDTVKGKSKPEAKQEHETEAEAAEMKSKEKQAEAPAAESDAKAKRETDETSVESDAVKKEEPGQEAEEGEEGEEPEDGAAKGRKPKTEAAPEAPALMDPLSFIIPKKKFGKGAEPRRPPPLPVSTTLAPSPGARHFIPSRSPSASPVAVEALPIHNTKPRTKNVVPVKSVPVTPQEREFMRLARKKNSFFTAASPAPLTSSSASPYSVTDASGKIVPDLTLRMKCPTKKRMKTETLEFPHAFFGVSMVAPRCAEDTKISAAGSSSSSVVNCYEQLQFQQRDELEAYERKLYGTDFVPQFLRARRTLIIRNARYERKSSGLRFNTHRDREDFEAKLSARYKINKSVPRCEIPPKNWQLIMNQRQANIFLHYQHIEDAALAAARFVDDRGEPLAWKGPGPAPKLLSSSVASNSVGRSPAPAPSPSTTPQPSVRPRSPRRRPRSPPRRNSSPPPRRERHSDMGIARENRFNRSGDPHSQENHRRQEEWGPRDGPDAQYAPPRRQSMDDRLGMLVHREPVHDQNGRPRSRSRSRSRSIAHATDDSQGTASETKAVSDAPESKSEKEGSDHSSNAAMGDAGAPVSEAKDIIRQDPEPRRNEEEFRRDRRPSQDHSHYAAGYESGGGRRMDEQQGWRNDREGRNGEFQHQHQPPMDEGYDRGRAYSRDWDDRRERGMRMNEGDARREQSRSRPRSFDHGREGPPPSVPHGSDHGHWQHGGDRSDHGRPHEMDRYQEPQRHRNPDMGMYGPGAGDGAGGPPHDRPRSGSRDRRHRSGSARRNRKGGARRF